MIKQIKILLIKLKWVLYGKKEFKEVANSINEINGIKPIVKKKKLRPNNGHYASTKKRKMFNEYLGNKFRV